MTRQTTKQIAASFLILFFMASVFNGWAQKQSDVNPLNYSFSVFNSSVDYTDREFSSSVKFNQSVFESTANFWDADFAFTASFDSAKFEDEVLFNDAKFQSEANFPYALFSQDVVFTNAEFSTKNKNAKTDFSNASFKKPVNFDNVTFNGSVDFRYLKFCGVSCERASFLDDVDFSDATFDSAVNFNKTKFSHGANFKYSKFNSDANFQKAEFYGDVDFSSTEFTGDIDFSFVTKISDEIDLTMALIPGDEPCYINLVGASINKIRFRYKRFKLWFPPIDSTNSGKINLDYDLKASVYEALLQKQKNEGFTESYEILDKEYREFKYTYSALGDKTMSWGQLKNWVDKHWWGYGYNKELIVLNSILLYLVFAFFNAFFLKHLTNNVYQAEKINEYWEESTGSRLSVFIKSVPFSLFYTAQIFFGFKFNMDKLKYKENLQGWKIFNLMYFIIVFLSGLVCLAYLMNYVLTV